MTELEIAEQIRDGVLPSPQQVGEMALFAVRVTGTGLSYRSGLDEFVWREPAHYCTPEFLARCSGLPIIWEHPDQKALNSEEFGKRVIGTIMLPYIQGDEVWGIGRIYDAEAIDLMTNNQLSTSPGVVFTPADGNVTLEMPDGDHLLIEGKPSILDHVAVVKNGVWDKGGEPTGVLTETIAEDSETAMAEEKERADAAKTEERDDAARSDAASDIMTKLDAIASKLDAAHRRMDAMEEERERERKDAQARRDAEDLERREQEAREKNEGEKEEAKADESEDEATEERIEKAEREENRADRARKDESLEQWAKEEEKEEAHRKDADEKQIKALEKGAEKAEETLEKEERSDAARRRADARADAAVRENAALREKLARMEADMRDMRGALREITRETPAEERDALAMAQARADAAMAMFGERAPAPVPGETSLAYRKRLLTRLQKHSPAFKDTSFTSADNALLTAAENQIFADAQTSAKNVAEGRPGVLVPVVSTDYAGRQITRFVGDNAAWMSFFQRGGQRGKINRNLRGLN